MDRDLLRAFTAVVDHGGFSAAARHLHCTQSAVSLQIKRLEAHTGQRLFRRTSRRVQLTEAGGTLLPFARHLLQLQQQALAALEATQPAAPLRFGLTEEQAMAYLPTVLERLARDRPAVHLQVDCALSTELIERFDAGELDVALTVRHRATGAGRLIAHESLVWVARDGYVPPAGQPLPLAVNPQGCIYRARALDALSAIGRAWTVVFTSQNPTGINLALQAGLGLTIKTVRSIPAGCTVLGPEAGLPPLGQVAIELHQSTDAPAHAVDSLTGALSAAMAATPGVLPAADWNVSRPEPSNARMWSQRI